MGTLRTLFAVAVVFTHSYGFVFVGGRNAVQLFYMISGFLISYVLVERKTYATTLSFYINRYLRLYPIYFVVAMTSLLLLTAGIESKDNQGFFGIYNEAPLEAKSLLLFSNLAIFGQDWVMFSGVQNDDLVFTAQFQNSDIVLYRGLLLPQAWTLGVELSFYLIAPLVLHRKRVLLSLLIFSIAIRGYLFAIGIGHIDPWIYRFFPAELAFFLLGALAHQVLLPLYRRRLSPEKLEQLSAASTYALIFVSAVYWLIPLPELIKSAVLILLFSLLMPFTFVFQSRRQWDRRVGDLSYPIYICHLLVIGLLTHLLAKFGIADRLLIGLLATGVSIGVSVLLNTYIAHPIESLRRRFRSEAIPAVLIDTHSPVATQC